MTSPVPMPLPEEHQALHTLYPELTPEQLPEAAYYLKRYLDWVARVSARQGQLTDSSALSSMESATPHQAASP